MWNIIFDVFLLAVSLLFIVPYTLNLRNIGKGEVEISARQFSQVFKRSESPFHYWSGIAFTIFMIGFGLFLLWLSFVGLFEAI
jgi:hypothetical protein